MSPGIFEPPGAANVVTQTDFGCNKEARRDDTHCVAEILHRFLVPNRSLSNRRQASFPVMPGCCRSGIRPTHRPDRAICPGTGRSATTAFAGSPVPANGADADLRRAGRLPRSERPRPAQPARPARPVPLAAGIPNFRLRLATSAVPMEPLAAAPQRSGLQTDRWS